MPAKGTRKRGPDIAGKVRGAMMLAIKRLEAKAEDGKGESLADLLEKELEKEPLAVLKAVAPWIPKEVIADVDVNTEGAIEQLPETAAWLAENIRAGEEEASSVSGDDGPVLPAALPPEQTRH
jgi:hypothetical protein